MTDPIQFPNPGDAGYPTDGLTCEVFSFGWTSGCTNELGDNRGFTQEWYYDTKIGAWVSVTVEGGSGTLQGGTYDQIEDHQPPTFQTSGDVRKFAFLDPITGEVTFDYIAPYDLIDPSERGYNVADFVWPELTRLSFRNSPANRGWSRTAGLTLCGVPATVYNYWSSSYTDNSAFNWYINRTQGDSYINPLAQAPLGGSAESFIIEQYSGSASTQFVGTIGLPRALGITAEEQYTENNPGEVKVYSPSVPVRFTYGEGPNNNVLKLRLRYSDIDQDPAGAVDKTIQISTGVRTDNWVYVYASTENDHTFDELKQWQINAQTTKPGGILDGRNIVQKLLDPSNAQAGGNSNYIFRCTSSACPYDGFLVEKESELGIPEGEGNTEYVYIAIPTRCGVNATHLFQQPGTPLSSGFNVQPVSTGNIINERGYSESYDLWRTTGPNSVDDSGLEIRKLS